MAELGGFVVPVVIVFIIFCGIIKKQNVFDLFLSGAKEGITIAINILPALIGLMMAIEMFKASGAFDLIVNFTRPLATALHFPSEVLPLALMRPISGSGALSIFEGTLKDYGTDSFIGRIAAVLQGSTETTFYTVAIYYGTVGVTKTRHTIPAAISADIVGFIMSVLTVNLFFK